MTGKLGSFQFLLLFLIAVFTALTHSLHGDSRLSPSWDAEEGKLQIRLEEPVAGLVYRLESGERFGDWVPVGVMTSPGWETADDNATGEARYYRAIGTVPPALEPHGTWRGTISFPDDDFLSEAFNDNAGQGGFPNAAVQQTLYFVKFTILLDDLTRVIFQNSKEYPFHYNFAEERLAPFEGMGREEFDSRTLRVAGQEAVLGSVIFAPGANEYAIQFVGLDAYPPETLRFLYDLVDAAIQKPGGARGLYIPTFEQAAAAEAYRPYFLERGIEVGNMARWQGGNSSYSEGWAIGRLVLVAGNDIENAYTEGRLTPNDILLTDGVPAEVPFLQGIVTLNPSTPNSHVAILSRAAARPSPTPRARYWLKSSWRWTARKSSCAWGNLARSARFPSPKTFPRTCAPRCSTRRKRRS